MSLPILVIMVVFGITAIVAAVHFTGGSTRRTFAGTGDAAEAFRADFPDAAIRAVWLTRDRADAFLELADGRLGLVHAVGARALTRIPAQRDIVSVDLGHNAVLTMRLRDFTWPGGKFAFDTVEDARAVLERLPLGVQEEDGDGL